MKNWLGVPLSIIALSATGLGQAISVNGGSIQGTVTDPTGAVVPNAQITIASPDTGYTKSLTTDSAGFYSLGPLNPGGYTVSIVATGFQNLQVKTVVRTGTATTGSFKLTPGSSSETVEVNAGALQVNTDQPGVSDVITSEQIKALPVNGRNFLDLAQIEPGVILQSGESFDPTKAGYSAISVGGVSGRTTRILLDGQDITDETVGTTIFNVSQGSINEFQLNRSTQDVSGEVTSTGQVLVSTNSGTNAFHGQLFYNFQDHRAGFALTKNAIDVPFQRNQFGGSIGGPIIKDKLFFFGNAERIKQDSSTASSVGPTFQSIFNAFPQIGTPYRETYSTVRLDYNGPAHGHYFVRVNYNVNSVTSNFGDGYWLYANRDNTPGIAGGADYAFGHFTHSFRGSYEKFHNLISDGTAGNASIYNGIPGLAFYYAAQGLYSGPNYLAPQGTYQSDKQFRYDGSWTKGAHTVRYGYSMNRILGGGFASFFGLSPRVRLSASNAFTGPTAANPNALGCNAVARAMPCISDPIHGYFASTTYLGNGQGYFTENSGFNLPGGGVEDWRQGAYVQDSWKVTPSFTLSAGVRWSVDTDRANQGITLPNCSDINAGNFTAVPCTGGTKLFSQWNPAYTQNNTKQPWTNFGPQIGFAFSPGAHKTSIRGAFGIFYENDVFNNTTNARNGLIRQGAFFDDRHICAGTYSIQSFPGAGGNAVTSVNGMSIQNVCNNMSLAQSAPYLIALQNQYQAATRANSVSANSAFVGENLTVNGAYGPQYRTPYSEQWNGGIEQQIFKGAVIRADYVHSSTLKIGTTIDQNHIGAARYLNTTAARNAIAATTSSVGCSGGASSAAITCAIAAGAVIDDFAGNGLDSGNPYLGGSPATAAGLTPNTGAAFAGVNPLLGSGDFILPIGRSGYDALQVVYRQVINRPVPGVQSSNFQVSYNLSRIVSSSSGGSDQFFSNSAWDNDNPNLYMGRAGLDHTHQVNFGGSFIFKYGPQVGFLGHFYSAAASSLTLDPTTVGHSGGGGIFVADVNGDGSGDGAVNRANQGDILPGTNPGDYMHSVTGRNLSRAITAYNNTHAGQLTPAGQALVNAGLISYQQLYYLGGTQQAIAQTPQATGINNPAFRSLDVNFSYPIRLNRVREGLSLEPAVAMYNVANLSNFTTFTSQLLNVNSTGGATNSVNGYISGPNTYPVYNNNRIQRGSGTFDQGAPRTTEFQLKLNF